MPNKKRRQARLNARLATNNENDDLDVASASVSSLSVVEAESEASLPSEVSTISKTTSDSQTNTAVKGVWNTQPESKHEISAIPSNAILDAKAAPQPAAVTKQAWGPRSNPQILPSSQPSAIPKSAIDSSARSSNRVNAPIV
ncbi:hypothetical protein I4U23_000213 [Adineta vaga]|nr:hypothetical protein I4U23_000213 [Adineta vaga]